MKTKHHASLKVSTPVLLLALLLVGAAPHAQAQVLLDIFHAPGCDECEQVKRDVLPEFDDLYEGLYSASWHDLSIPTNVPLLIAYQQRCQNEANGRISIVVDHTIFLSGYQAIATGLTAVVNSALVARQNPNWQLLPPPDLTQAAAVHEVVRRKAERLTWPVVIGGGLLDGINPCAISTLIFFMSVLVMSKVGRRTRLMVGISFIAASFVVYTALGLGFLYAFRRLPNFTLVKSVVELIIGVVMVPLALLSFRDALRFRATQQADEVTLQIPRPIKLRIHRIMRSRLGWGGPIIGGLVIGAGVTILESVCTGQSYLPVLTFMLRGGTFNLLRFAQLLVYNLCFVLPLIIVFMAFHRGVEIQTFIAWSKRNLVVAKLLLGIFFTAMALIFLWPALRALITTLA